MLQVLRITLHVGFAVLLAVGVVRVLLGAPHAVSSWVTLALAVVLAAVYLAGTVAEKQAADGGPVLWGLDPAKYAVVWLAVITGLWLLLLVTDADFSWLAFPLFFLHLHLLGTRHAIFAVVVMTAAVVAAQWYHAGELHVAMVLGPVFGAAFAVVMAMAYQSLYAEGVNQRLALDELRRTRAELARTQHEAGVLAERERLAREIHDTLAQGLSSIVLVSRAAGSALAAGQTGTAHERIGTVQSTAAENLAEARRFVRGLSSPGLEDGSLIQSLRRACEATGRQAAGRGERLECRFELDGDPVPLPAPFEVALLRAAQSSLSNVALHAEAGTAVVTLGFVGPEVTLDVFDDGIGFDAPAALAATQPREDGSGFGLLSVRERVSALGGTLGIESAPGEGTVLAVKLPLPEVGSMAEQRSGDKEPDLTVDKGAGDVARGDRGHDLAVDDGSGDLARGDKAPDLAADEGSGGEKR